MNRYSPKQRDIVLRILRSDVACCIISLCAVVSITFSCLLWRRGFFFNDDNAAYYLPAIREISRLIYSGHWPFITERLWNGGSLLAEYQHGVLNPVSLILAVVVGRIDNFELEAAVWAASYLCVFAGGTYALLRSLRCSPSMAMIGAVVAPTCEWVFYWGAVNWFSYLSTMAWLAWAAAAATRCAVSHKWLPGLSIAVAMVVTAGCPFTNFAMGIICVAGGLVGFTYGRSALPMIFRVGLGVLLGVLLAAPALTTLAPLSAISGRPPSDELWHANFRALLGLSTPFAITAWRDFYSDHGLVFLPMLATSWFVAPVLASADWRVLWRRPEVRIICVSAGFLAVGSLGGNVGQIRWMFRLLMYLQFAIVLLAVLALKLHQPLKPWRSFLVSIIPLVIFAKGAWVVADFYVAEGAAIAILIFLAIRMPRYLAAIALVGHIILFAAVAGYYSQLPARYPNGFGFPTGVERRQVPQLTRYAMFAYPRLGDAGSPAYWAAYHGGNTSLDQPGAAIQGYSPFFLRPFQRMFCTEYLGATSCDFAPESVSRSLIAGSSFLDLARVDEVLSQPHWAASFQHLHPDWRTSSLPDGGSRFDRIDGYRWPAPIGAAPEDAAIKVRQINPAKVELTLSSKKGGPLVLARAWYPGWQAKLNGRPIAVTAIAGLMPAIVVPPATSGSVTFTYWPAGLTLGLALSGLACLTLVGLTFLGMDIPRERTS